MDDTKNGLSVLTVDAIKALRVKLDQILQTVENSGHLDAKAQVIIKIKESRHWLGECLKELGNVLPAEFADEAK